MKLRTLLLITFCVIVGCSEGQNSQYPMEKRYWDANDYDKVIQQIKFHNPKEERFPEFKNPETAPVIKKLLTPQNFLVLLEDTELGLSHRNELANDFFQEYKDLSRAYNLTDRQDKFVYGRELIEIQKFGLELQLIYFRLGNENIIKNADDSNSKSIQDLIKSNEKTIVGNYNNYLDLVNQEDAMDDDTIQVYCDGIDIYFDKLYNVFPNGDRNITKQKAELMLKKAKSNCIKNSLSELIEKVS